MLPASPWRLCTVGAIADVFLCALRLQTRVVYGCGQASETEITLLFRDANRVRMEG